MLLATEKALSHWWWAWLSTAALVALAVEKIRPGRPLLKILYFVWLLGLVLFILIAALGLYLPMSCPCESLD